jgi:hypothetical protein
MWKLLLLLSSATCIPAVTLIEKRANAELFKGLEGANKLVYGEPLSDALVKISQSNLGAARVLFDLADTMNIRTPGQGRGADLEAGSRALFRDLDRSHIVGNNIWKLYKHACDENLLCVHTVIEALYLRIVVGATEVVDPHDIYWAIEYQGQGLDLDGMRKRIRFYNRNFLVRDYPEGPAWTAVHTTTLLATLSSISWWLCCIGTIYCCTH